MLRFTIALMTAWAVLAAAGPAALASGGSTAAPPSIADATAKTPEQLAGEAYNSGLSERDRAWKLEKKLARQPEPKRAKTESRIEGAYKRAVRHFESALGHDARSHRALTSLGYAKRRLGDHDAALAAYDRALAIAPGYGEALEYRAEAYLELDRADEAIAAYDPLQDSSPKLAMELVHAVKSWVIARREGGNGDLGVGELDRIERWADEHMDGQELAESSLRKSRSW